jgi:hypothetical protein
MISFETNPAVFAGSYERNRFVALRRQVALQSARLGCRSPYIAMHRSAKDARQTYVFCRCRGPVARGVTSFPKLAAPAA